MFYLEGNSDDLNYVDCAVSLWRIAEQISILIGLLRRVVYLEGRST